MKSKNPAEQIAEFLGGPDKISIDPQKVQEAVDYCNEPVSFKCSSCQCPYAHRLIGICDVVCSKCFRVCITVPAGIYTAEKS